MVSADVLVKDDDRRGRYQSAADAATCLLIIKTSAVDAELDSAPPADRNAA
jgi:hypothetical protein